MCAETIEGQVGMFRGQYSRVFDRHAKMVNFFIAKMSNYTVFYFITLEFVNNSVRYATMKYVFFYNCVHELKYLSFCFLCILHNGQGNMGPTEFRILARRQMFYPL